MIAQINTSPKGFAMPVLHIQESEVEVTAVRSQGPGEGAHTGLERPPHHGARRFGDQVARASKSGNEPHGGFFEAA